MSWRQHGWSVKRTSEKIEAQRSQRQKSRSTLQNGHAQPTAWICVTSYSTNISREWHSSQIQAIQMKPLQNGGAWHSSHQKSMLKCSLYCGVNGYDSVEETRSGIINHPYSDGSYHPCKYILQTLHYRTFYLVIPRHRTRWNCHRKAKRPRQSLVVGRYPVWCVRHWSYLSEICLAESKGQQLRYDIALMAKRQA